MKSEDDRNIEKELVRRISVENGCPICAMIMDYEFNFISKVQYSVSKDKNVREEIALEGGFCDFHFRQFKKIANGKTNILLLKSIIEFGSYKNNNYSVKCRICKVVDAYEAEIVKSFPSLFNDQAFHLKFENGIGICFDHLNMIKTLIEDKTILEWLFVTHIKQIERLYQDFDDMSKIKSFYEIDRSKRKLINVLIEKLAGRKTRSL